MDGEKERRDDCSQVKPVNTSHGGLQLCGDYRCNHALCVSCDGSGGGEAGWGCVWGREGGRQPSPASGVAGAAVGSGLCSPAPPGVFINPRDRYSTTFLFFSFFLTDGVGVAKFQTTASDIYGLHKLEK